MRSQLHHVLADASLRWPMSPALTYKDATMTYAELWSASRTVGAGLQRLGVKRGDRVGIYLDKRLENVTAVFGTSAASGVFVPINPVLRQKQVAYILDNCSCRMLVTTAERLAVLREELVSCPSIEQVIVLGAAPRADGDRHSITTWDDLIAGAPADRLADQSVVDYDMGAILYTSGSTGMPRGSWYRIAT